MPSAAREWMYMLHTAREWLYMLHTVSLQLIHAEHSS